jgi:hypothetical protein
MEALLEKFIGQVAPLKHPESWITTSGLGVLVSAFAFLVAGLLNFLDFAKFEQVIGGLIAAVVVSVLWWVARWVYWRAGGGRRVGIAYEGFRIPIDDWADTRKQLSLLCEGLEKEARVRLKLIPAWMTANEKRWERTQKKLNLPLIFRVIMEKEKSEERKKVIESKIGIQLSANFGVQITKEFKEVMHRNNQILFSHEKPEGARDALHLRADSLFNVLLYYVGLIDFTQLKFQSALRYFRTLENRISFKFKPEDAIRVELRSLLGQCLTLPSSFPADRPPEGEELLKVVSLSEEAAKLYGEEQPFVYGVHSRNLFYLKDLMGALAANEKAISLSAAKGHPKPVHAASFMLNRAVLNLFTGNEKVAAESFKAFFAENTVAFFNWRDLIKFADFSYEYGYTSADFMRALYRRALGKPVPEDVQKRLTRWLGNKPARGVLAVVLNSQQQRIKEHKPGQMQKASQTPAKLKGGKGRRGRRR